MTMAEIERALREAGCGHVALKMDGKGWTFAHATDLDVMVAGTSLEQALLNLVAQLAEPAPSLRMDGPEMLGLEVEREDAA